MKEAALPISVRLRPPAIAARCAEVLLAGGLAAAVSAATFTLMSGTETPAQAAPPAQTPPAQSPLSAASRHYELSLMRSVEPGEKWGVTAAADPGSGPAVKNGWLPDGPPGLWVINSIGVLRHGPPPRQRRPQSPSQPAQPGQDDLARSGQEETVSARCGSFQFGRT